MDVSIHAKNKRFVHHRLLDLCTIPLDQLESDVNSLYSADAVCSVACPVNDLKGSEAILAGWWRPLRTALPDAERRHQIVIAGESDNSALVAVLGHYQGTFEKSLLDIPATGRVVHVRYGELHAIRQGCIARSWLLVDFLDLMRQANCFPLAPPLGTEGLWPSPTTETGIALDLVDPIRGAAALEVVRAMHHALLSFDGKTLESMDHAKYWTPHFMWYGPSGIGTTRGLAGFRAHHQIPFLRALPDRTAGETLYLGDGDYAMNMGWPGMGATHTGGDWLGLAPTGKRFMLRVMDFYRFQGVLIAENWVPIDLIDILHQLGVDVFARMRHLSGRPDLAF